MKKIYLILAAVAAMTVGAQAQELMYGALEVGDYTNADEFYNGSYFDMAPTNFYLDHYAAQMLYLYDTDFTDLDGKENVELTKICYKFNDQAVYSDISSFVTFYLKLVDESEFQTDADGDKIFFEASTGYDDAVVGMFDYEAFTAMGEDVEIAIDLSEYPFALPKGKNLVITAVFDLDCECMSSSDDAPFYTSGIGNRVMTYSDNYMSFFDYEDTETFPKCSVTYCGGSTNAELPVTRIEYTYTESDPTAVTEVEAARTQDGRCYDMMGREVNLDNFSGIYIQNGKKFVK